MQKKQENREWRGKVTLGGGDTPETKGNGMGIDISTWTRAKKLLILSLMDRGPLLRGGEAPQGGDRRRRGKRRKGRICDGCFEASAVLRDSRDSFFERVSTRWNYQWFFFLLLVDVSFVYVSDVVYLLNERGMGGGMK